MADSERNASPVAPRPYPWHGGVWQQLTGLQRQGRLPHAILLTGPAGGGKGAFAAALAEYMLCKEPGDFACGRCKSCLLNQQGTHPDSISVHPDEPGKAIKVDQIRGLADFIGSAAQQGGFRVLLISPADEMNVNAANALLKGLEEPGRDTLFVLISDRPGRVMPTIRSRCQHYPLALPGEDEAQAWLHSEAPDADAQLLLRLSGGAPLTARALHLAQGLAGRDENFAALEQIIRRQVSVTGVAAKWAKKECLVQLEWLASVVGDLVRIRMAGSAAGRIRNPDAEKLLQKLANLAPDEKLFEFRDKIQEYRSHLMRRSNPNQQLLWEDLLIDWRALFTSQRRRAE